MRSFGLLIIRQNKPLAFITVCGGVLSIKENKLREPVLEPRSKAGSVSLLELP